MFVMLRVWTDGRTNRQTGLLQYLRVGKPAQYVDALNVTAGLDGLSKSEDTRIDEDKKKLMWLTTDGWSGCCVQHASDEVTTRRADIVWRLMGCQADVSYSRICLGTASQPVLGQKHESMQFVTMYFTLAAVATFSAIGVTQYCTGALRKHHYPSTLLFYVYVIPKVVPYNEIQRSSHFVMCLALNCRQIIIMIIKL